MHRSHSPTAAPRSIMGPALPVAEGRAYNATLVALENPQVDVTLYHNPRCSKSRETLALLRARGVEPIIIDYLEQPPSADTLRALLQALGLTARQLLRDKEAAFTACGLEGVSDEARIIAALVAHPILMERPIVVRGTRAVLGRPPSNIEQLFE